MTPQRAQELEAELRRLQQCSHDEMLEIGFKHASYMRLAGAGGAFQHAADLVRDAARGIDATQAQPQA